MAAAQAVEYDAQGKPLPPTPQGVEYDAEGKPLSTQPPPAPSIDPGTRTPTGEPATGDTRNSFQRTLDNLTTPDPRREEWQSPARNGADTFARGVAENVLPMISHPIKSIGGILQRGGQAIADNPGSLTGALSDFAVKPLVEQGVNDYQSGGATKAILHGAGTGIGMWATGELGGAAIDRTLGAAGKGIKNWMDPLKEYRSPAISPEEAVGRRTADILKVNPSAYRNTFSSVAEHAPYIKDFAESTGNKFKTPLDFSKAATGAGQESSNFFKQHLIEPNAELQTPHGTIAEVHQRLGDINDELRPAYRQRTGGQELTALERKALETERDKLNHTLYETLSERSGLPTERIQGINQRGGALQNVGDEADAAQAMRRAGFSGYTPTGLPIPMGMIDHIGRMAQYLRGGPEAVAGRQLSRVFKNVGPPAEGLPDPAAIGNYRQMAEQSDLGNLRRTMQSQEANQLLANARKPAEMRPTKTPVEQLVPDTNGAKAIRLSKDVPRAFSNIEEKNAAAQTALRRSARESELLEPARTRQLAAALTRKMPRQ